MPVQSRYHYHERRWRTSTGFAKHRDVAQYRDALVRKIALYQADLDRLMMAVDATKRMLEATQSEQDCFLVENAKAKEWGGRVFMSPVPREETDGEFEHVRDPDASRGGGDEPESEEPRRAAS